MQQSSLEYAINCLMKGIYQVFFSFFFFFFLSRFGSKHTHQLIVEVELRKNVSIGSIKNNLLNRFPLRPLQVGWLLGGHIFYDYRGFT